MRWFTRAWWRYLLAPRSFYSDGWLSTIRCRMRGHPLGVVWHNPGGSEPDYHCRNCGDLL